MTLILPLRWEPLEPLGELRGRRPLLSVICSAEKILNVGKGRIAVARGELVGFWVDL